jgi:hypothetical protein
LTLAEFVPAGPYLPFYIRRDLGVLLDWLIAWPGAADGAPMMKTPPHMHCQ